MSTVYFDSDGVLADFDGYVKKTLGTHNWREYDYKYGANSGWDKLHELDVFRHLDVLEIGKKTLYTIKEHLPKKYDIKILTKSPKQFLEKHTKAKQDWFAKHFPGLEVIVTDSYKFPWSTTGEVLVDDDWNNEHKNPWISRGGYFVKYYENNYEWVIEDVLRYVHSQVNSYIKSVDYYW